MSVSEGQPALTPEEEQEIREWLAWKEREPGCPDLAMGRALAELAREREATAERLDAIAQWERADAEARRLEGRVRELREVLEHTKLDLEQIRDGVASNPKTMIERRAQMAVERVSEALVGLPERQEP